jgi:hypothetical protein
MEIKSRISSAIQPKVSSDNTEIKSSNPAIETVVANTKDSFESDPEIASAKDSRDIFQVIDSEATYEFLIGNAGRLLKGDHQNDISLLKNELDELKKSDAEIQEKLVENTGTDSSDDD